MLKHIIEAGAALATLGAGVYAYKRKKGMAAPPVAPVVPNVKPPVPQGPVNPAPSALAQLVTSITGSTSTAPIVTNMGGGATNTLLDTGMSIDSGGSIGQPIDTTGSALGAGGGVDDTTTGVDTTDTSALDDLAALLTG